MSELIADSLKNDPRIREAKRLIREALSDHQSHLQEIAPPREDLRENYERLLNEYSENRGGRLFFPYLGSGLGRGPLVELADGSIKYDFIAGIGVHFLGHGHPRLIDAGINAALADTVMQGNLQQNTESARLASLFLRAAQGSRLDHCFLTSSGVMANENGLKMIFQKHAPAGRLLAFEDNFAGRTLAVAQITDKPGYRQGLPPALAVDYVPFYNPADPDSTGRSLNVLRRHLRRYPGAHAAMIFELIQGEGGFNPGEREFFRPLMEELRQAKIAVMVDEIQTFGRTGRPFAFQDYGLEEYVDVVTVGKMTQACATLFTDEYRPQPGLISQTFTSSTSAIHAAIVILEELLEGEYFGPDGKNEKLHRCFCEQIENLKRRHGEDKIRGPFGRGVMVAFEVYDGSAEKSRQFIQNLFQAGVICFIAGSAPTRVRFLLPAGAVACGDIERVAALIDGVLGEKE